VGWLAGCSPYSHDRLGMDDKGNAATVTEVKTDDKNYSKEARKPQICKSLNQL